VSLVALIVVKAGQQPRLIYRVHQGAAGEARRGKASPRRIMLGYWTPRTSSTADRSCWSGAT